MTTKLTQEEFLSRANKVHGDDYDYKDSTYKNNTIKIQIFCIKHQKDFYQSPNKHMSGQGCPICRYDKTSKSNSKTTSDFIAAAKIVHGNKYNYDLVNYSSAHEDVEIICTEHQIAFFQKATIHLAGSGCPHCAKQLVKRHIESLVLTKEQFTEKAREVHGDLYNYDSVNYIRSIQKVDIWCNRHSGYFKQSPNNHLSGVGCASCAKTGYSTTKPGNLYVLACKDITKIGITNFDPSDRAQKVSKSFGDEFLVKCVYQFSDGATADTLETNVLRILKKKYACPTKRFEGYSECFIDVDYENLLFLINQELALIKETNGT